MPCKTLSLYEALALRADKGRELRATADLARALTSHCELGEEDARRALAQGERGRALAHDYAVLCKAIDHANHNTMLDVDLESE